MTPRLSTTLLRAQADQRLVELVQAGHEAAFTAIVERYRPQLHRYARRMLPESRCEDAVQQAFMQAWRALQDGKDVRQLRPWLYTIVHNASVNQLRQGVFDYRELLDTVQGPDDPSEDVERLAVIRQTLAAVAALPERQRDALLAVVVAGRPQAQVAVEMGLTENGLRQLLFRARSTLRSAATAITPLPLLAWAARAQQSGGGGLGGRIGEAAAGAGAVAGGAHVLQTGTALIVAGSLAVGGATALQAPHSATASRSTTLAAVRADPAAAPVRLRTRHSRATSRPAAHHAGTKRHSSALPTRVLLAAGHGFRVAPLPAVSVAALPEIVTPAPQPRPVAEPAPAAATTAPALAALPASPTAGPTPTSAGHGHGGGDNHGSGGTTNSSSGSSGDDHDGGGGGGGNNDGGSGSGSSDGGSGSTQSAPASGGDSHSGPGSSGSGSGSGSSGSSGSSSSTTSSSASHSGSAG